MGTFRPHSAVPAFPGAMYKLSQWTLWAIFQAKACSRPPDPISSTFMFDLILVPRRCDLAAGNGTKIKKPAPRELIAPNNSYFYQRSEERRVGKECRFVWSPVRQKAE